MKRSSARLAAATAVAALAAACSLLSLEQLAVASCPSGRNQVIGRGDRITVRFSITPDRACAEDLARILAPGGAVELDFAWEGNVLVILPAEELPAGERLVLSLCGDCAVADGRSFPVALQVPFFVQTAGPRPRLSASEPADGAWAGIGTALVFRFTLPMEAASFAEGFSMSPGAAFDTAWSPDSLVATVTPREAWENLSLYTWQVGPAVKSAAGVRLGTAASGCFYTQEDPSPPVLVSLRPAQAGPDGSLTVVDAPLDGNLRARDCILLAFSEDVRLESLERAFRVDPAVSGFFRRERAGEFLYVPCGPWVMARRHHLVVSTDVVDLAGNRMAEPASEWFLPDIPVQSVVSVTANGGPEIVLNSITPVDVPLTVDGEVVFVVQFAQPFDQPAGAEVPFAARCQALFPLSIPDPGLKSAAWGSGTSLTITFSGFSAGAAPLLHCYRLLFPGGPAGVPNADGSYLEEDAWVALVAR